jgi:hypothetical protein
MDPGKAVQRERPTVPDEGEPEAIDFVRFCYRRRRVGWPELYDEMCAVAGRGLYHGYAADDLSQIGVGFALYEMPALAGLVQRVVAEDQERRRLSLQAIREAAAMAERTSPVATASPVNTAVDPEPADQRPRLVAVPAGA